MKTGAEFSPCGNYRYRLWRVWDDKKPLVAFCMLNPSIADDKKNDPTVERCQRRAEKMGYGGLVVVNIFAYISTDPDALKRPGLDIVGLWNNVRLVETAKECDMMICGWGKHGSLNNRADRVMEILKTWVPKKKIRALKINKDGSPAHPLYIGYDVKPIPFDFKP